MLVIVGPLANCKNVLLAMILSMVMEMKLAVIVLEEVCAIFHLELVTAFPDSSELVVSTKPHLCKCLLKYQFYRLSDKRYVNDLKFK